jgi:hypothetical protein
MFDFRYHALSLIAVLVALVLGLLLGVAIGDKGLVSSAGEQHQGVAAQGRARRAEEGRRPDDTSRQRRSSSRRSIRCSSTASCRTARSASSSSGDSPTRSTTRWTNALAPTRAARRSAPVQIREPLAAGRPRRSRAGTRYETLATWRRPDVGGLRQAHGRAADAWRQAVWTTSAGSLFSTVAGSTGPYDGVVIARNPRGHQGRRPASPQRFEKGLTRG